MSPFPRSHWPLSAWTLFKICYYYLCISSTQMSRHTLGKTKPHLSCSPRGLLHFLQCPHLCHILFFFFSFWHKDAPGLPCIFFFFFFSSLFFLSCLLLKPTISSRKADSFITMFRMQLFRVCSSLPWFHCSWDISVDRSRKHIDAQAQIHAHFCIYQCKPRLHIGSAVSLNQLLFP